MSLELNIEARPANWLPLPGVAVAVAVQKQSQVIDEDDLFPKGEILSFYPNQGYGYLKNARGDRVIFRLSELDFVGSKGDRFDIAVGSKVGYDVFCTSSGPHVSKLKIY